MNDTERTDECSVCQGQQPSHEGLCPKHQRSTGHRISEDGYCSACKKVVEGEAAFSLERIVAAAIRMDKNALVLSLPRPARHNNVLEAAVSLGMEVVGEHEQGFLTSEGRFVRRSPARRIAKAAGQLTKEPISNKFTSEELW